MWIVVLALRRPYTFTVMAILIVVLGALTISRIPKDIFPAIDIPVVTVVWSYTGISPQEMERRIVTITERAMTTTVNDIEHIESQSLRGVSAIKVFFHPRAKIEAAVAQITAICQTLLRPLPPGITPPFILRYDASSVPVLQMGVTSETLPEQTIFDLCLNVIRTQLATVQGASIPLPYGGKQRQIMVDLDLKALYARGVSGAQVSDAINAQNLILPAGTVKIGNSEYNVSLNASTDTVDELNDLPLLDSHGALLRIRDVAHVRDGFIVQTNVVHVQGRKAALMTILKNGGASTLDVVKQIKDAMPRVESTLPTGLNIHLLFDQSLFVNASLDGVLREGLIAAFLTAVMILVFLGSWRSTLIVIISIPLAILCSVITLGSLGETLNIMTLGGLSLAVGILVDDATVEVENIHRNLSLGKTLVIGILDGAQQIAVPTFVSTLSICIVFVSVVFLTGPAKYLFTPLAEAVVFAMMSSYLLSRTVIPNLARYLLSQELDLYRGGSSSHWTWRLHEGFNHRFLAFRNAYQRRLEWALKNRRQTVTLFMTFILGTFTLIPLVGQDFFPTVDAGQFRLHVRCIPGTRLEETERDFSQVTQVLREVIPPDVLWRLIDNIGQATSGIALAFGDNVNIGPYDGEILVELREGYKAAPYVARLRPLLRKRFPYYSFFFQPADIVNQILNFGLPSPIDIQISGRNPKNLDIARQLERQVAHIPGAVDVHIQQVVDTPELRINVDRDKARQVGLTQLNVGQNLLIALSGSQQTAPNFWLDPRNGVSYSVIAQAPQTSLDSVDALMRLPISVDPSKPAQLLANLGTLSRGTTQDLVSHYNVQPLYDIFANVDGRDLGGVFQDVNKVMNQFRSKLPKGTVMTVRGQALSMAESMPSLGKGLCFAIILVYLLMAVNFQSWVDPLIIIMALPGALSGVVWMLYLSQTTFNVPSMMGAIMCIGVATANSILMVTFANERREEGDDAMAAALAAGVTRLRPVLMTALAMILGMLPMSLGLGEGGEQNAPLGRAVIGGLILATITTLFLVPVAYSVMRKKPLQVDQEMIEAEAHYK